MSKNGKLKYSLKIWVKLITFALVIYVTSEGWRLVDDVKTQNAYKNDGAEAWLSQKRSFLNSQMKLLASKYFLDVQENYLVKHFLLWNVTYFYF